MSRLLCCLRARRSEMGAALSQPQEGEVCEGAALPAAPPTMADVIRERKKKAAGSGLGTLRRRIALVRRPRDNRPDRGCEHARFIRSVVSRWRLVEVFQLCEELEAGAALRDLVTQAELAREPAADLHADLAAAYVDRSVTRVPLEGAAAGLTRAELEAVLLALYAGAQALQRTPCALCHKWERNMAADGDLDIINVEVSTGRRCVCRSRVDGNALRRAASLLGFSLDTLHRDMTYLLDSGEWSDARLVFRSESGAGAAYGFRSAVELPCHRLVLAARSRFFRSVMSRRCASSCSPSDSVCVCLDEKVLPRRFARALLHAAYSDHVDLSLIGRSSGSPSSTNGSGPGTNGWGAASRGSGRPVSTSMLDDAFQLYEIARFVEMPIVVQGCEDAIVEALTPDTLPHVLRWSSAPHASHWVHRQAMRYLRDEFPSIMWSGCGGRVPASALSEALSSRFLHAGEPLVLRAVLRWATDQETTSARRVGRRREAGDAALRDALAPLAPLLRLEHLPPDHELLHQVVRRGILQPPAVSEGCGLADAWLARGSYRPPRCFLPYLDEIKALLEDQAVPEAELARARRERYLHRIPDTLYMVSSPRPPVAPPPPPGAWGLSPRVRAVLRARAARLARSTPALTALRLHAHDTSLVYQQIALRAVREMSLPDACADLLLPDLDVDTDSEPAPSTERQSEERSSSASDCDDAWRWPEQQPDDDCCRPVASCGSVRGASAASLLHSAETSRASCRRELPARPTDGSQHHRSAAGEPAAGAGGSLARLSAAVPDVAMAPNANTHLLTARDYFRLPPWEYCGGGVLQLDLGDGATHTPRPGSRAARAGASHSARPTRDHTQAMSCLRSRADDNELRAAIELSVMRAYSSFGSRGAGGTSSSTSNNVAQHPGNTWRDNLTTAPSREHTDLQLPTNTHGNTAPVRGRGSPPPARRCDEHAAPRLALNRVTSGRSDSTSPSASPRPVYRHHPTAHQHHEYRLESSHGSGSASGSVSPNTYA